MKKIIVVVKEESVWKELFREIFWEPRLLHFVGLLNFLLLWASFKVGLLLGHPSPSTMDFIEFLKVGAFFATGFTVTYLAGQIIISPAIFIGGFTKSENCYRIKKDFNRLWYRQLSARARKVPINGCQALRGIFKTSIRSPIFLLQSSIVYIIAVILAILRFLVFIVRGKIVNPLEIDLSIGGSIFTFQKVYFSFNPVICYALLALFFLTRWFNGRFAVLEPEKSIHLAQYSLYVIAGFILIFILVAVGIRIFRIAKAKRIYQRLEPAKKKNFFLTAKIIVTDLYKAAKEKYCPLISGIEK